MLSALFERFFKDETFHYTQEQREAAIDILLLMIHADGRVDDEELRQLRQAISDIGWEAACPIDDHIAAATTRVQDALVSEEARDHFVAAAFTHLHSAYLADKLLRLCRDMAAADHVIDAQERALLRSIEGWVHNESSS